MASVVVRTTPPLQSQALDVWILTPLTVVEVEVGRSLLHPPDPVAAYPKFVTWLFGAVTEAVVPFAFGV